MKESTFDTLAQGFSRRASLASLSAAGLLAFTGPATSKAKKRKKKKKTKNACAQQTQQCIDAVTPLCAPATDPEECETGVEQCCQLAGLCEALIAVSCVQSFFLP